MPQAALGAHQLHLLNLWQHLNNRFNAASGTWRASTLYPAAGGLYAHLVSMPQAALGAHQLFLLSRCVRDDERVSMPQAALGTHQPKSG